MTDDNSISPTAPVFHPSAVFCPLEPVQGIWIDYTNYRGERSVRDVKWPKLWFGYTKFHPVPQLLMTAFDAKHNDWRDFAVANIHKFSTVPLSPTVENSPAGQVSPPNESQLETFTASVARWVIEAFGLEVAFNLRERTHRFCEEALEFCQSLAMPKEDAHKLVEYVYNRPIGDPKQEIGGVMVTLAAACHAYSFDNDIVALGRKELSRCYEKIDVIREKQARKKEDDALPGSDTDDSDQSGQ